MYIALIVLVGGAGAIWWFSVGSSGPSTLSSNGMYRPGASGIAEQIFFAIFGAPRDTEKERVLSERLKPVATRVRRGFQGRGADRRW